MMVNSKAVLHKLTKKDSSGKRVLIDAPPLVEHRKFTIYGSLIEDLLGIEKS